MIATSDSRVKWDPGETFHRLKRSSLVASCALIVTYIHGIKAVDAGGLIGLSFASVDMGVIRSAIWLASVYYTWGFLSEAAETSRAHRVPDRDPDGNRDGPAIPWGRAVRFPRVAQGRLGG